METIHFSPFSPGRTTSVGTVISDNRSVKSTVKRACTSVEQALASAAHAKPIRFAKVLLRRYHEISILLISHTSKLIKEAGTMHNILQIMEVLPKVAADRLGMTPAMFNERYSHLLPTMQEEAVDRIEQELSRYALNSLKPTDN
ncbi:hypothetical protein D3C81_1070830 [compost metagenome]